MNPTQPPPGALVLARGTQVERQAARGLVIRMVVLIIALVVLVAAIVADVLLALGAHTYPVLIAAAALVPSGVAPTIGLVQVLTSRRLEAAIRGVALWVTPDGITYAGPSGVFPGRWPNVRGVRFQGRPGGRADVLRVDVVGWGGPLTLRLPLAGTGVDRGTIARAVHELSRGRVTVAA